MMKLPVYSGAPLALLAAVLLSCDQKPVGVPVATDTLNWRTVNSFSSPDDIRSIWGTAPDNVYVTHGSWGSGPPLTRFDGSSWSEVALPSGIQSAGDIAGISETDFWVSTNAGLLHFDGMAWQNTGVVWGLAVSGSGEAYAMGRGGASDVLVRYNGASWDTVLALSRGDYATALWASDEPLVVAAVASRGADSLVWWDGSARWSTVAPGWIRDFWGGSSGELLAAGNSIWRWNGTGWDTMPVPPETDGIADIDGPSLADLYAVGGRGTLFRFDGAAWLAESIPTERDLGSLLAFPAHLFVGVGAGSLMQRDGGGAWSTILGSGPAGIDLVWAESAERMLAVDQDFTTWEWNSGAWTERLGNPSAFYGANSLAGLAIDDVYAASGYHGVLHYDGATWSAANDTVQVEQVAVSPSGTVFAINSQTIYRLDGAGWSQVFRDESAGLYSLWAGDGDVALAGGFSLVRVQGNTVEVLQQDINSSADIIRGIGGVSSREVYIAADRGLHALDGSVLKPTGPPGHYADVVASRGGTVLAVGYPGHALRSNGYWQAVDRTQIRGGDVLTVARDGSFIRLSRNSTGSSIFVLDE